MIQTIIRHLQNNRTFYIILVLNLVLSFSFLGMVNLWRDRTPIDPVPVEENIESMPKDSIRNLLFPAFRTHCKKQNNQRFG